MSKRNKLQKFAEILSFPHVFENFDHKRPALAGKDGMNVDLKGKWSSFFKNENPIVLELACGGGEYTLALANENPNINYIGVDIKGARIWKGASKSIERGLDNVAFLRTKIEQIHYFFEKDEISEIWITFPDPFLRKSKANRRLTSAKFLDLYRMILKKGGLLHLKTDSPPLYEFSLEVFQGDSNVKILYKNEDIYGSPLAFPELEFKTFYEYQHLADGRKIKYIRFQI
jgi:tRNA (guanine-N7-)-methyltransferase